MYANIFLLILSGLFGSLQKFTLWVLKFSYNQQAFNYNLKNIRIFSLYAALLNLIKAKYQIIKKYNTRFKYYQIYN